MPVLEQYQLLLPSSTHRSDGAVSPLWAERWHRVFRTKDPLFNWAKTDIAVTSWYEPSVVAWDVAIRRPEGTERLMKWWDGFASKGGDLEGWQLVKANLGAHYPSGKYS